MIKKLTERNMDDFFTKLNSGDIFTYSQIFHFDELRKLAEKHGKQIEYNRPGTIAYIKYGAYSGYIV